MEPGKNNADRAEDGNPGQESEKCSERQDGVGWGWNKGKQIEGKKSKSTDTKISLIDKRDFWAIVGQTQPGTGRRRSDCEERPWRQCMLTTSLGSFSKRKGENGLKFEGRRIEGFLLFCYGKNLNVFLGWEKNSDMRRKLKVRKRRGYYKKADD